MNLKIEDLKNNIESIWKNKENISSSTTGKEREVIEDCLALLDSGQARVSEKIEKNFYSTYHLFIIKLDVKYKYLHKKFFNYLRSKNMYVNVHYLPIHLQPFYRKFGFKKNQFPVAKEYSETAISIPIYPNLKKREQIKIINYIKLFFKKYA